MTPAKEQALAALITYPTQKQAAEAVGIAPRTMRSYLEDEEFRAAYVDACRDMVAEATRKAQRGLELAVGALSRICEDEEAADGNRIAAARALLEYGIKLTEITDILAAVSRIEAAM